jgi:hypothetical protein
MKPTPPQLPADLERELFVTALEFCRAEPWRHLANAHYLFVAEPSGGRRVLAVLGNGGEQFGLQSYAASCAAQFLVLCEELPRMKLASPTILYEILDGVDVEFTGKGELDAHDLARAARCDHRPAPRVRQAWPKFRAWRPNRFQWHIHEADARRLLADLRRALRWAALAPTLRWTDLGRPVALRQLPVVAEGLSIDRPWTAADLTWERLVMPPTPAVPVLPVDFARTAAWRALPLDPQLKLVVDERAPLVRIGDEAGGAPYFPRVGLCLDNRTAMILGHTMGHADAPFGSNALGALESAIRAVGCRPALVLFVGPNLVRALLPALQGAEIEAGLSKSTSALDRIWANFG